MHDTRGLERMAQEPMPIRSQSVKHKRLFTLMNRVDALSLLTAHDRQSAKKAVGIDGITKEAYGEKIFDNLLDLVARMKAFKYIPQPVRRTYIPKLNGKLRPLGIPAYEDKLVQSVMANILSEVYEPRFLDTSYGFREGRSAHDVVKFLDWATMKGGVKWVLEADIRGFFDNVNHDWLMKFLRHDIGDRNFLRYISRFLKAGVMEGTELSDSDKGTPQGGLISPVLANVYLHYALDLWVEHRVKAACKGHVHYVRYADDFVLLFQYESDARYIMGKLKERLAKFDLEVAEEKTRILPFDVRGGRWESFDFLGFTFYVARARAGFFRTAIRTSAKKLKAKRQAVTIWLRRQFNQPVVETLKTLDRKLQGHWNYYGVSGNMRSLTKFYDYVTCRTLWALRRRGQRKRITWEKFAQLWRAFVRPPRIMVKLW